MRRTRTKSFAKTFLPGTDLSELMIWAMDNVKTEWVGATEPIAATKHKYVITVTLITDKCNVCDATLDGTYNGPVCPKCDKQKQL
jgi:rubrerythrin